MAINFTTEQPYSLSEIGQFLPKNRHGRPPHYSTIMKWVHDGVRSRITGKPVKLESAYIGRVLFTTREAIGRFIALQNGLPVSVNLPAGGNVAPNQPPAGQANPIAPQQPSQTLKARDERIAKGYAGALDIALRRGKRGAGTPRTSSTKTTKTTKAIETLKQAARAS